MRALIDFNRPQPARYELCAAGLRAACYQVVSRIDRPEPSDVVVMWNRMHAAAETADRFEAHGARVVVLENGYLGKTWRGQSWYAAAIGHHCGAGEWRAGGPARWDGWGVELQPWRSGDERVILAQRGIGEPGLAAPYGWAEATQRKYGGRIRKHPGENAPDVPIEEDLANAGAVFTWNSAGALRALMLGVPVFYEHADWIGAGCSTLLPDLTACRSDEARLAMFRRLAWATWTVGEIEDGTAFRHLLV